MASGDAPALISFEPAAMKTRFKQRCVETNHVHQNWQIRVHRALSWLKRSAELPEAEPDLKFMLLWVSLNSLYSRWDAERNAPGQDAAARHAFLSRVCEWDGEAVAAALREKRGLAKKLLENAFLSNVFWRDPRNPNAKTWAAQDAHHLDRNLRDGAHGRVLEQVMDRLYVLRGQMVHGAATGGGKLNRQTLRYCLWLLERLAPLMIHVVIEHGRHDDWPELCYPPLS
jgi:hypothetical protein